MSRDSCQLCPGIRHCRGHQRESPAQRPIFGLRGKRLVRSICDLLQHMPALTSGLWAAQDGGRGLCRLTNSQTGCFSGCLEDHALPDLDGMVGKAFIKPAQEGDINSGRDAVRPVLLPEKDV